MCGRIDVPAVTALGWWPRRWPRSRGQDGRGVGLIDEAMLPVLADEVPHRLGRRHLLHRAAPMPPAGRPAPHAGGTQSMERWCEDFAASVTYGGVCDVHRLQLLAATDDYRLLEDRLVAASRRWRMSTAGRPARASISSARCAGCVATPMAHSPRSPGRALWASSRNRARRCCAVAGRQPDRVDRPAGRAGGRGPRAACGCCAAPSRSRWPAIASTRPKGIAPNSNPAPRLSAPPAFARGRCTPAARSWRSGRQHAEALDALQSALREYRTQQSRYETAQVYEWMAIAHKALGDDELAAADAATAENIYAQLGVEPAQLCGSSSPGGLTKREIEILSASPAAPLTGKSPSSSSSARRPSGDTWPISTPSSESRRAPPRWRGRTATTCCSSALHRLHHGAAAEFA